MSTTIHVNNHEIDETISIKRNTERNEKKKGKGEKITNQAIFRFIHKIYLLHLFKKKKTVSCKELHESVTESLPHLQSRCIENQAQTPQDKIILQLQTHQSLNKTAL